MLEPESILSAKQVAEKLHISSGMLRRYALALEEITGQTIRQHPRDGRQYSADDLETLQRAKAFITANRGMSVDRALRLALGASEGDVVQQPNLDTGTDAEALVLALERVTAPLLDEIKALRLSNERLSAALESKEPNQGKAETGLELPHSESPSAEVPNENHQDGALVRLARRFETLLGRKT